MNKIVENWLGRYFWFAIFCALICAYKNWDVAFNTLIASFFLGGLAKVIWGKND